MHAGLPRMAFSQPICSLANCRFLESGASGPLAGDSRTPALLRRLHTRYRDRRQPGRVHPLRPSIVPPAASLQEAGPGLGELDDVSTKDSRSRGSVLQGYRPQSML